MQGQSGNAARRYANKSIFYLIISIIFKFDPYFNQKMIGCYV